ncbi:MAG: fructokinase [Blastocatellia bacterium]|nr:fructokinase [Blastocatellia bacterium]
MKLLDSETASHSSSTQSAPSIVGLGELIWDLLPGGKQLGGAPTNFAYISRLLGNRAIVASRVGADELGREALRRLEGLGISTSYLQLDATHPTGTVGVTIDAAGEPHFSLNENSAWDYLQWTAEWEALAPRVDAVCFGTLGQRHQEARETALRFLKETRADALRLFDVNLRHSFFTAEMLIESLRLATMVKLNSEELMMAARMLRLDEYEEEAVARQLLKQFAVELVAVTRGAQGSLLVTARETINHPGFQVRVADTIGAGDAFTATLAHCYLRRAPLKLASEAANRMGSWIATQTGATPPADSQLPQEILGELDLNQ